MPDLSQELPNGATEASHASEPPADAPPGATPSTGSEVSDAVAVDQLRSAVMRLGRRLKHQRVDESLSPTEMSVLSTLATRGSATPGELARKEHVQPPSMTRIVALLEGKGLVRLELHPEDRRQKVVSQTERAQAMLEESRRKRNAWLAELVGELTEEERATLRSAAPVLEKLAHL